VGKLGVGTLGNHWVQESLAFALESEDVTDVREFHLWTVICLYFKLQLGRALEVAVFSIFVQQTKM